MFRMTPPTCSELSSVRTATFSNVTPFAVRTIRPERSLRPNSGSCARSDTCPIFTFSAFSSVVTPTEAFSLSMRCGTLTAASTPAVPTGFASSKYSSPSVTPISPTASVRRHFGSFGSGVRALINCVSVHPSGVFSTRMTGLLSRMSS